MFLSPASCIRCRRAFTLVELMVVIVLISIFSALILPEMAGSYQDAKLKATARQLITLCSFANSQAISLNEPQRIRFDLRARRYRLERTGGLSGTSTNRSATSAGIRTEGEWDEGIRLEIRDLPKAEAAVPGESRAEPVPARGAPESPSNTLLFRADGTTEARQITLEDRAGFRLALQLNPTTARIRIGEAARK